MKTRTVFLTLTLEIFEIDNNERKQIENRKKKPKLKKKKKIVTTFSFL